MLMGQAPKVFWLICIGKKQGISVWKGIAQDAIVMNLDDLLCVGIYDKLLFSSTIDRNKNLIPAEVLKQSSMVLRIFLIT
jgi:phosphoribosylformylglycinamidine cyclo-ligase